MLKTGKRLYFHSTLQKERSYLQLFWICHSLLFSVDDRGWSVVVLRVRLLPLILNLLLLLVQISDLQRHGKMDRGGEEVRYEWEGKREGRRFTWEHAWKREEGRIEGGGEDHEVRSVTWGGKAKNNSLIIHNPGLIIHIPGLWSRWLPAGDWETEVVFTWDHQGLGARGWKAGQWIMCEQQALPESAVPLQQGGTVRRKTMKHHIFSPTQDQGKALILSLNLTGSSLRSLHVFLILSDLNEVWFHLKCRLIKKK